MRRPSSSPVAWVHVDAIRDDDRRDASYIARRSRSRHARECGGGGAFTERCRPQAVASSGMHRGQLNLWTEWALVRSEDVLNPRNSKFYFWVEPIGEGAGSGFTRAFQDTGDLQQQCHVWSLVDATIHTGSGRTYPRDPRSWAYPAGSEYWSGRDPELFGCDCRYSGSICPANGPVWNSHPDRVNPESRIRPAVANPVASQSRQANAIQDRL